MADNFACRESRAVLDIDAGIAPAEEDPSSFIVGRREEVKTYVEAVGLSVILERRHFLNSRFLPSPRTMEIPLP
jgi:hypothetical protein